MEGRQDGPNLDRDRYPLLVKIQAPQPSQANIKLADFLFIARLFFSVSWEANLGQSSSREGGGEAESQELDWFTR